ncbi:PLP-dependent aminotransferase family protein [Methylobacterium sp. NPDC080182]|uniref:MocR-like pyridoxine biosynthesis transcription factor PdxR n=1 Tax=Methylobacterium sp. NPDC080182 TaxID=3390590 RepID=UPI003D08E456
MARVSNPLPLTVEPLRAQQPKGRWVLDALRSAIREGRVRPGDQIPSSRDLARQWGISRGLINAAYEALQAEDIIYSKQGSGTYVRRAIEQNPAVEVPVRDEPLVDPNVRTARHRIQAHRPFISRETDVAEFPVQIWKRIIGQILAEGAEELMSAIDVDGYAGLREQIAIYLGASRGIRCEAGSIIITTGIRHSLDVCLRALRDRDGPVWMEEPGYAGAAQLIALNGMRAIGLPVDRDGGDFGAADETARRSRMGIVTPSHQSPLGVRLSYQRRESLLAWAQRSDAYLFEDDYDSEFAFDALRLPALKAMDADDRVIYAGSFNKLLFPTLRIGYMVVPERLKDAVSAVRFEAGRSNSALEQHAVSRFISEGHLGRHIRRLTTIYERKAALVYKALCQGYGGPLDALGRHGGFHFLLVMPAGTCVNRLKDACTRNDMTAHIVSVPSATERGEADDLNGIVIGYSSLPSDALVRYGTRLGALLREAVQRR